MGLHTMAFNQLAFLKVTSKQVKLASNLDFVGEWRVMRLPMFYACKYNGLQ